MALSVLGNLAGNLKDVNFDDRIIGFTALQLCFFIYLPISDGLGLGLIMYVIMMFVSKRAKKLNTDVCCSGSIVIYLSLKL